MQKSLDAGISYLHDTQSKNGSFVDDKVGQTTLESSLILAALADIDSNRSIVIRNGLAVWLTKQKGSHGSFNYQASPLADTKELTRYPDDLDSTFCALIGIQRHDSSHVDGRMLAQAVKLLIATETKPGGPYRTWLVTDDANKTWLDVDLAVNANISYFLTQVAEPLPNLTQFIEKAIESKSFRSPYYPNEYPVLYYLSRAYNGPMQSELAKYILSLQQSDGNWGSPMHTALAISSLLRLGYSEKMDTPKRYLLRTMQDNGSWPAQAFHLDRSKREGVHFNGSAALTTALVLEALHLLGSDRNNVNQPTSDKQLDEIHGKVIATTANTFKTIDTEIYANIERLLMGFADSDLGRDIVLLPRLFYSSLKKPVGQNEHFFVHLGLANLYGWLAYTIYDDFLDEEGTPMMLSGANVAMRESLKCFDNALEGKDGGVRFCEYVGDTFNIIDAANNWEVSHCRFKVNSNRITLGAIPDYGNREKLAERSLGHALTPLAVLVSQGISLHSREARNVLLAMHHYLIARQLNDDLHDWYEDLSRGHITYVVAELLRGMELQQKTMDIARRLPSLQKYFWNKTIVDICQTITEHTSASRKALSACKSLQSTNVISTLLDGIDSVNAGTLKTVADAKGFIETYGVKSKKVS